jgi:adenosylcobinamide kinase/adenosylcobinamide-phosphate guanylyltransferase
VPRSPWTPRGGPGSARERSVIALVLGGARSGKSRYAASVARALSASPVMLATSRILDPDHAARIARHRAERGAEWTTIDEETAIARADLAGRVAVVDCVTLWLTNLFLDAKENVAETHAAARTELGRLAAIDATWILVSNELGMAPHAATEMGRKFVDLQGFLNQEIAARAKAVTLVVAGIPLPAKGGEMVAALRAPDGEPARSADRSTSEAAG